MHPTQHTTIPRVKPRILRTHELITKGVSTEAADAFVVAAVQGLQSLSKQPAKPLHIAPAPAARGLHELLSQASEKAKAFTPRRPTFNTEAA
jgi:hypothetical protein